MGLDLQRYTPVSISGRGQVPNSGSTCSSEFWFFAKLRVEIEKKMCIKMVPYFWMCLACRKFHGHNSYCILGML